MIRNNDHTDGIFSEGRISFLSGISAIGIKFQKAKELGASKSAELCLNTSHFEPMRGKIYLKYVP
ncbi:hypothetical protein [Parabacteroides sp. Marseille-P3160]|uniref:hypothetical protein n=1 Tax=Parabacteroides sp. Marseille-P3160 TaxID=1917887 RepID=UPI0009BAC0E1|nr:hypothetical protein [Parabacteroides sp. Marseille-P3160]